MKKQIFFLGLNLLLLVSCSNVASKNDKYINVEIEECSIPIPKLFKKEKFGNREPYTHSYSNYTNQLKYKSILTRNRYMNGNDNIEKIEEIQNNLSEISKNLIKKTWYKNNFTIKEFYAKDLNSVQYYIIGTKTIIVASNIAYLNYLLDYCQKTWKLDKEKEN